MDRLVSKIFPPQYEVLKDGSSNDSSTFLEPPAEGMEDSEEKRTVLASGRSLLFWKLCTVFFTLSTSVLFWQQWASLPFPKGSYETGFRTELDFARSAFALKEVRFSGSPGFDENGDVYREVISGMPQYAGPPSPEIDAAWEKLLEDRWFNITEAEAQVLWGDEYEEFRNEYGYMVGIEVFHVLHCVNAMRMALDPDYYDLPQGQYARVHKYHCIDAIRQSVMCNSDFTPLPTRYWPSVGLDVMVTNRVHTCRDFERLRQWTSERVKKSGKPDYERVHRKGGMRMSPP